MGWKTWMCIGLLDCGLNNCAVDWTIGPWVGQIFCVLDSWFLGWKLGLSAGQLGCGLGSCAVGWTTGQSQLKLGKCLSSIQNSRESLNAIHLPVQWVWCILS